MAVDQGSEGAVGASESTICTSRYTAAACSIAAEATETGGTAWLQVRLAQQIACPMPENWIDQIITEGEQAKAARQRQKEDERRAHMESVERGRPLWHQFVASIQASIDALNSKFREPKIKVSHNDAPGMQLSTYSAIAATATGSTKLAITCDLISGESFQPLCDPDSS